MHGSATRGSSATKGPRERVHSSLSFLPFTIKDTIVWVIPKGLLATQRKVPWLWG